jgi:coenzyme F420-reducing hydrogenase gamma subunit
MTQLSLFPELEIPHVDIQMTEEEAKYLLCNLVEGALLDDDEDEVVLEIREAIKVLRG